VLSNGRGVRTNCTVVIRQIPARISGKRHLVHPVLKINTMAEQVRTATAPKFCLANASGFVPRSRRLSKSNTSSKTPKPRVRPLTLFNRNTITYRRSIAVFMMWFSWQEDCDQGETVVQGRWPRFQDTR